MSEWWAGAGGYDVPVESSTMHVVDTGGPGEVLVFLHGNPTSAYLWRHVVAGLPEYRCVGVDLIGMGRSGKPDLDYGWADHRRYLTAALDAIAADRLILVAHDWGVGLGLEYARTHPDRVTAVALLEGHLRPIPSWADFDEGGRELFQQLRDPERGPQLVQEDNFFLDAVLPGGMRHELTPAERVAYHSPYPTPQSRRPIWAWTLQIPVAGDPPDVAAVLAANYTWLAQTETPRLLMYAEPGAVLDAAYLAQVAADCPGLRTVGVGDGLHFVPEDQPGAIADAVRSWLTG